MTLEEHFRTGYKIFGSEAMEIAGQFFGGEIDYDTFISSVGEPIMNYRIHKLMWDEIEETNPKMVKITSRFAEYLNKQGVEFAEIPDELPKDVIVGRYDYIPIEIDDTIDDYYYELVY